MKRNVEIDRLRAIGAISVVIAHIILICNPGYLPFDNGFGTTVIDLSFVISGFVISSILVLQIDQLKAEHASLIAFIKSFLVRRFFRIYPPLWTVFFMVLFLSIFFNGSNIFSTPSTIIHDSLLLLTSTFNFSFTDNISLGSAKFSLALAPFWSLTIEEQFYLFFPIFLFFTKNNAQRVKILITMILLITFVIRPLTIHHFPLAGRYFTQSRCDSLMYGYLIYIITLQPWFNQLKPSKVGNRWLRMAFISIFFYVIIGITMLGISPIIYLSVNGIVCSLLLLCATFESNIVVFPAIIEKLLDYIVPRSYTLYIIHLPIILLANELFNQYYSLITHNLAAQIIIEVIMILTANELIYQLILNPSLIKGKIVSSGILNSATQADETSLALGMKNVVIDNAT